jgi:hypothetical protein
MKAPTPAKTDRNPGNASKSGPSPGQRSFEALKGVRPTRPTVIARHDNNPVGGPEQVLAHHAAAAKGDKKPADK